MTVRKLLLGLPVVVALAGLAATGSPALADGDHGPSWSAPWRHDHRHDGRDDRGHPPWAQGPGPQHPGPQHSYWRHDTRWQRAPGHDGDYRRYAERNDGGRPGGPWWDHRPWWFHR